MSSLDTTQENSVMFNLRQIMQLQDDRVAQEERAARERRANEERAREHAAEQARAAETARALQEREAAERAATARETALLRLQLEAAAAQRAEDDRLSQTQRELAAVLSQRQALTVRQGRRSLLWAVVGSTLAGVGVWWMAESQAAMSAQQAAALSAWQAREVADLRARVSQLSAAAREPRPTPQPTPVLMRAPEAVVKTRRHTIIKPKPTPTEPDIDVDGDDLDPLIGLPQDAMSNRGARAKRHPHEGRVPADPFTARRH